MENCLNIGLRGHDVVAADLPELSDKLKEYGVRNVQLVLKRSCQGFKEGMFSPSFAKKIGETFAKNNVEISVLGCYINPSNTNEEALRQDMDYFVESLKYARYMNAGVVGLETGYVGDACVPEQNQTEEAYQRLLGNMCVLRDAAEKLGVTIAVEAVHCFVIHSAERMERLVADLNSPNIAVIFDALNLLNESNCQNQDAIIRDAFARLSDKIAVVHLKDYRVENGALCQCPIGEGQMNIPLILSLIKEHKPHIPVVLEETKEDVLLGSMDYLQKLCETGE